MFALKWNMLSPEFVARGIEQRPFMQELLQAVSNPFPGPPTSQTPLVCNEEI